MTAQPLSALPSRPLSVAEYASLPEEVDRYELQEGMVVLSPSPMPDHQDVMGELFVQLRPQLPPHLKILQDVDLDLQLVLPDQPATVRAPDLVVVTREEFLRVRRERGFLRADATLLVVEILSPGALRRDTVIKHGEYADAGIAHYWMIDISGRPQLTACHLAGEFGYADAGPATGTWNTDTPFPIRLDLDALL